MSIYTDEANKAVANFQRLDNVINGAAGQYVQLADGSTVPSLKEMQNTMITYLNDPGNHYTKAEMPSVIAQEVSNIRSAKTYYVDQVNGDDLNPGTFDLPVKSIGEVVFRERAISKYDKMVIFLKSDYIFDWNIEPRTDIIGRIYGYDNSITIQSDPTTYPNRIDNTLTNNRAVLTFKVQPTKTGGYNSLTSLLGFNFIQFYAVDIQYDESGYDPNLPFDSFAQPCGRHKNLKTAIFSVGRYTCPTKNNITFAATYYDTANINVTVHNAIINSTTDSNGIENSVMFDVQAGGNYNFYIVTVNNSTNSYDLLFRNLVKDVNGVPRNITMNIVI